MEDAPSCLVKYQRRNANASSPPPKRKYSRVSPPSPSNIFSFDQDRKRKASPCVVERNMDTHRRWRLKAEGVGSRKVSKGMTVSASLAPQQEAEEEIRLTYTNSKRVLRANHHVEEFQRTNVAAQVRFNFHRETEFSSSSPKASQISLRTKLRNALLNSYEKQTPAPIQTDSEAMPKKASPSSHHAHIFSFDPDDYAQHSKTNSPSALQDAPSLAKTTSSSLNEYKQEIEERTTTRPTKEEMQPSVQKDAVRRSSRNLDKGERKSCKKRKPRDLQKHNKNTEDGSDDSTDLLGAVEQLSGILQNFKRKVKREVAGKASQVLKGASHSMEKQVDKIQSQIHSDMAKYGHLCKAKQKQWETNLQDHSDKLQGIHDKFEKDIGELSQGWEATLSRMEEEETQLKSVGERQKASHGRLVGQLQESLHSQLTDAHRKLAALRKAAGATVRSLSLLMGATHSQASSQLPDC